MLYPIIQNLYFVHFWRCSTLGKFKKIQTRHFHLLNEHLLHSVYSEKLCRGNDIPYYTGVQSKRRFIQISGHMISWVATWLPRNENLLRRSSHTQRGNMYISMLSCPLCDLVSVSNKITDPTCFKLLGFVNTPCSIWSNKLLHTDFLMF